VRIFAACLAPVPGRIRTPFFEKHCMGKNLELNFVRIFTACLVPVPGQISSAARGTCRLDARPGEDACLGGPDPIL
jgi:hypothetical protein